jgi:hypothetical protein
MSPAVKRISPAIIGIAVLLCIDAVLIVFGFIAVAEDPPADNQSVEGDWAWPSADATPPAVGKARELAQDDPVLMRPIFFTTRKPFEPLPPQEAALPPSVPMPPLPGPNIVLDGVILRGGLRQAHLRQSGDAEGQWREVGHVIEGWTLTDIDATSVLLEQAGRQLVIRLYPADPAAFMTKRLSSRSKKFR